MLIGNKLVKSNSVAAAIILTNYQGVVLHWVDLKDEVVEKVSNFFLFTVKGFSGSHIKG